MKNAPSNVINSSANNSLESNREPFFRLGDPDNLLTKHSKEATPILPHYASSDEDSQRKFANLTMYGLIELTKKFGKFEKIFNFESEGISQEETEKMEEFYKDVADSRLEIALKAGDEKKLKMANLEYLSSSKRDYCMTNTEKDQYEKHHLKDRELGKYFYLKSCVTAIKEPLKEEDNQIILGAYCPAHSEMLKEQFVLKSDSLTNGGIRFPNQFHLIGLWTASSPVYDDDDIITPTRKLDTSLRDSERVDEITALVAKKALLHKKNGKSKEALDCALVFCFLRGYNLRSIQGACWAQEISFRVLLDAMELPQFRKSAGSYLDIAACCENGVDDEKSFPALVRGLRKDLKFYSDEKVLQGPDITGFLERPLPANEKNFESYVQTVQKFYPDLFEKKSVQKLVEEAGNSKVSGRG